MKKNVVNKTDLKEKNLLKGILSVLKFLKEYLLSPAEIILTIVSIRLVINTNSINNTTNLLQINNAIQFSNDLVFALDLQRENFIKKASEFGVYDDDEIDQIDKEKDKAIISLLNNFDFACAQYLKNKIDKIAFKEQYFWIIQKLKNDDNYSHYFLPRNGLVPYQNINNVYQKWDNK